MMLLHGTRFTTSLALCFDEFIHSLRGDVFKMPKEDSLPICPPFDEIHMTERPTAKLSKNIKVPETNVIHLAVSVRIGASNEFKKFFIPMKKKLKLDPI